MQIVIDSSIVVSVLLNEPTKPMIIKHTSGAEIIAPASLPYEIGNALSANVRRKRISQEQAVQAMEQFQSIDIRLVDIDLVQAIKISNLFNIYAYDAYILSCANDIHAPLYCLDTRMKGFARELGLKTIEE